MARAHRGSDRPDGPGLRSVQPRNGSSSPAVKTAAMAAVSNPGGKGWAFAGPGYYVYVWDDDERRSLEWVEALALRRSGRGARPA